jgi:O-antigen/teichoic acid export membrane protein
MSGSAVASVTASSGKRSTVRHGTSAIGFIAAKSAVFFAPLLLLHAVGVREYGVFEWALAWATPLSLFFCFGAAGSLPYFVLKRDLPVYLGIFRLYGIPSMLLLVCGAVAAWKGWFPLSGYLAFLVTIIFVLQTVYATLYRTLGFPAMTSLSESGNYVIIVLFLVALLALHRSTSVRAVAVLLTVYAFALAAHSLAKVQWTHRWTHQFKRLRQVLRFGFPLIFSAFLMALLTSSGRLMAGHFFSMEAVGTYSFFMRITSSVILIHQLMNTLIFPRVYRSGNRQLDLYFSALMGTILIVAIGVFYILPHILGGFFPLLRQMHDQDRSIFYVFCFQMVFWAGTAMLELIITRETMAKYLVGVLACCVTALLGGLQLLHHFGALTLLRLCQLNMSCMCLCFAIQLAMLWHRGLRMRFLAIAGTVFYIGYFATMNLVV